MARLGASLATLLAATAIAACGGGESQPAASPDVSGGVVLSGTLPLLNGEPQRLSAYRGKVVLVVNTASECGFSPQFGGLEELYREHRDAGFVVLGFPADDVAGQEPRSDEEIAHFCKSNFGVSFPMFAKSNVVSEPLNPVFARLGAEAGPPTWNFNKYLLDRKGEVVEHYEVATDPEDPQLNATIEKLLDS